MGLSQALWTGLSGLTSHQAWTTVVGNNLTNVNTTGFKRSDVDFTDILYKSFSGGTPADGERGTIDPNQQGTGVQVQDIRQIFTQGGLENTDRTFDCAIDGNGFFTLSRGSTSGSSSSSSSSSDYYYTRNGVFYLGAPESEGAPQPLLSENGLSVIGYPGTNGTLTESLEPITLPQYGTVLPGEATTAVDVTGNLFSGDPVINGNEVDTSTSGSGWISAGGNTINIGGVESTPYLRDRTAVGDAVPETDMTELQYIRGDGNWTSLFDPVPAGWTADSREITVEFKKGGITHKDTFIYGTDGTNLDDFASWMAGDLGDDGEAATQRLDGGAFGTIRTRQYTKALDGFDGPAEQAGAFMRGDATGSFLSIGSNLGSENTISDIILYTNTHMVNASTGEERNAQGYYNDFLERDQYYPTDYQGGSGGKGFEMYVPKSSGEEGTQEQQMYMRFSEISRDSDGTTWRWYSDGQQDGLDGFNKGTGLIRFGTTTETGPQVLEFTTDGGTTADYDFSKMTQVNTAQNINAVPDGYLDGELIEYRIDGQGQIYGYYTNGYTDLLAKFGLGIVQNPEGMEQIGGTIFKPTNVSGEVLENGITENNSFGKIFSGFQESSNVEMAQEMTKLLMSQRGYQVSSRIVTTADEMLKEAAALKK